MTNMGIAKLSVGCRDGISVVTHQYGQAPLQLHRPLYLDDHNYPTVYLRTPSAGLLGGDVHNLEVNVGRNSILELRTQASTLIYPGKSQQTIKINVDEGGKLIYLPHSIILASEAHFTQKVHIELAKGSLLQYRDIWSAGRIAMKEKWQFQYFSNLIEIFVEDELMYREHWNLEPKKISLTHPVLCGEYTEFSNRYHFGPWDFKRLALDIPQKSTSWCLSKPQGQVCRVLC
ncbi:MAG: urease accessory protein UreD [Gloeobacterales cyanobacterium]